MTITPPGGALCLKDSSHPQIVIVEDNREVLSLLKDFFVSAGHDVQSFWDSEEALNYLQARGPAGFSDEPHVVICDLTMPKITGLELTSALKKLNDKIPVILITAYGDRTACEKSIEAGAYAFLPKPFSLHKIKALVDEAAV